MTEYNYGIVESLDELRYLVDKIIAEGKPVGLDCETGYDGPDKANAQMHPEEGFIAGISFTNSTKWARYLPLRHDWYDNPDNREAAEILWPLFRTGLVVAHNLLFEERMISAWFREYIPDLLGESRGYFPARSDTMIECSRAGLWRPQGLKALTFEIFGHKMTNFLDLFPGAPKTKEKTLRFNILELTPEVVSYACEDALWCLAIHEQVYDTVKDNLAYKLEMSVLLEVMADMHDDGVVLDWLGMREYLQKAKDFLNVQYSEIQSELSQMLGKQVSINLNSPQQVSKVLYEDLGFSTTRMTKTSKDTDDPKMSTDAKALEGLAKQHPVVRKILEWKEVKKLIGSYLEKYERDFAYDKFSGRAHPQYNQTWVISGRFSCSEPNIQQLPAGNYTVPGLNKKITRYIAGDSIFEMCFRDFVMVPEGWYGLGFDYSNAELRALAGESGEPALWDAFLTGADVHIRTASLLFGIPEDQIGKESIERKKGKTLIFSILYGQGIKALAESLGISFEEAEELYDKLWEIYPKVAEYVAEREAFGKKHGYVVSRFDRKMRIWEYEDPKSYIRDKANRMAVNCTIQSSATGDYPKIAMVRAKRAIRAAGLNDKVRLVMNVHDALEFYVHSSVDMHEIIELLEPAVVFPVPGWPDMIADWHTWNRYGSPKDVKKNNTGHWTAVEEKEELITTEIKEFETTETEKVLIVEINHQVSQDQLEVFIDLVRSAPGNRVLQIQTPRGLFEFPDRTSLSVEDSYTISLLLGSAVIRYKNPREMVSSEST